MPARSRVTVGVVGCGRISGPNLTNFAAFPNLQVVALADVDVERASAQADTWGIPRSCTLADLLADPGIEQPPSWSTMDMRADIRPPTSTNCRRPRPEPLPSRRTEEKWQASSVVEFEGDGKR